MTFADPILLLGLLLVPAGARRLPARPAPAQPLRRPVHERRPARQPRPADAGLAAPRPAGPVPRRDGRARPRPGPAVDGGRGPARGGHDHPDDGRLGLDGGHRRRADPARRRPEGGHGLRRPAAGRLQGRARRPSRRRPGRSSRRRPTGRPSTPALDDLRARGGTALGDAITTSLEAAGPRSVERATDADAVASPAPDASADPSAVGRQPAPSGSAAPDDEAPVIATVLLSDGANSTGELEPIPAAELAAALERPDLHDRPRHGRRRRDGARTTRASSTPSTSRRTPRRSRRSPRRPAAGPSRRRPPRTSPRSTRASARGSATRPRSSEVTQWFAAAGPPARRRRRGPRGALVQPVPMSSPSTRHSAATRRLDTARWAARTAGAVPRAARGRAGRGPDPAGRRCRCTSDDRSNPVQQPSHEGDPMDWSDQPAGLPAHSPPEGSPFAAQAVLLADPGAGHPGARPVAPRRRPPDDRHGAPRGRAADRRRRGGGLRRRSVGHAGAERRGAVHPGRHHGPGDRTTRPPRAAASPAPAGSQGRLPEHGRLGTTAPARTGRRLRRPRPSTRRSPRTRRPPRPPSSSPATGPAARFGGSPGRQPPARPDQRPSGGPAIQASSAAARSSPPAAAQLPIHNSFPAAISARMFAMLWARSSTRTSTSSSAAARSSP